MIYRDYKVSIRLMTYNHADFIYQAMEGILMQKTNFLVEVVIGDDFSIDDTLEKIRKYKSSENIHLKILERQVGDDYWKKRQETGRLYNFVNILENCSGKYIALLDGDDYWTDPLKLQKQVDFLESKPHYSGCYHDTRVIHDKLEDKLFRKKLPLTITAEDTISTSSPFHTSSFLFKAEAFQTPTFLNYIVSVDMALFSIIAKSGLLGYIEGEMSIYRKHEGGITNTAELINNYHPKRIELANFLNEFHDFKYQNKTDKVIEYHMNAINEGKAKNKIWPKFKLKVKNLFK